MDTFVKYFFIFICSLTTFTRLLNIKPSKINYIFNVLFALSGAGLSVFLRQNFTQLSILIFAVCITLYNKLLYKRAFDITIVSSVISLGISFALFTLSIVAILPIGIVFLPEYSGDVFIIISQLIAGVIENVFIILIFKIRRLKSGMPFLLKKSANEAGVYVSVLILLGMSFGAHKEDYVSFIFVFVVIFGGLFIYFWWRKRLYSEYLKNINQKEMERLREEVEVLKQDNEKLAGIIHKDNKILPALITATENLLSDENDEVDALRIQIKQLYDGRCDAIKDYKKTNITLAKTGVLSTDGAIGFLYQKALSQSVNFDVSINANVRYLTENVISQADLNTVICDLADNAIISTKNEQNKNVLLVFGIDSDNYYRIDVFDSGEPFEISVLEKIGTQKITTHKNDGGSGIGLVTVSEILRRYNASLEIEQNLHNTNFTKRVSVLFNNKNEIKY